MGQKFSANQRGEIEVDLSPGERDLLAAVVGGLDGLAHGDQPEDLDPGYSRLHPPVYLGNDAASSEWWRLMGEQLEAARSDDRAVFESFINSGAGTISASQAQSLLRVVNQGRLVYAARLGIDVPEDFDDISDTDEVVLWFLSFVVDDLSDVLGDLLP